MKRNDWLTWSDQSKPILSSWKRTIAQMSARMIHVSNLFYTDYQAALGNAKVKVFPIQPGEKITF